MNYMRKILGYIFIYPASVSRTYLNVLNTIRELGKRDDMISKLVVHYDCKVINEQWHAQTKGPLCD